MSFSCSEVAAIVGADASKTNIREIALTALLMVEAGEFSNHIINKALEKHTRLDARDRALFVKLVHGTLEYQYTIDHLIDAYSKVKVRKMKPMIRNLLRMSVYQLLFLDKIPAAAVVDESVKLVKKSPLRNLSGFVNGVLRSMERDRSRFDLQSRTMKYSVPEELLKLLDESLMCGDAINGDMVCGDGIHQDMFPEEDVPGNPTDDFLAYTLSEQGTSIRTVGTDEIRMVQNIGNLTELPEWKEGKIIVQDYASSLPVRLSSIRPGDTVLDVCAAPGGKSIQAAERVGTEGKVIACDLTLKKTGKITENCRRTGITNIETRVQDATVRNPEFVGIADVVIADLPCSGLGTIGKKPEIKNRFAMTATLDLAEIQKRILNNVCEYVKPGGELVFSTCTISHYENEDNVRAFLAEHPAFAIKSMKQYLPTEKQPMDGFFVCVMERK